MKCGFHCKSACLLLNLAAGVGNISKACRIMDFSRDTFYRCQAARDADGVEAVLRSAVDTYSKWAAKLYTTRTPMQTLPEGKKLWSEKVGQHN